MMQMMLGSESLTVGSESLMVGSESLMVGSESLMVGTGTAQGLRIVPTQWEDSEAVVALFGALHAYNASLDAHFALADDWQRLLREELRATLDCPNHLWLLLKDGNQAVALLIAAIHTDSPMFRHRQWVEVEGLYVAPSHRCRGIAHRLLDAAYAWAKLQHLARVQLYVTASNEHAQEVYTDQGFTITQAIMRKRL